MCCAQKHNKARSTTTLGVQIMSENALEVFEVSNGSVRVFGGVYAANDGFFAEIHEQRDGSIRRVDKSDTLPSHEIAVAWMQSRPWFKHSAA